MEIIGSKLDKEYASKIVNVRILELLKERGQNNLTIPQNSTSQLIGKGGNVLRRIKSESGGCEIRIFDSLSNAFAQFTGNGLQRQKGRFHVLKSLKSMLESQTLQGPEESFIILWPPFPSRGSIFIEKLNLMEDVYYLNCSEQSKTAIEKKNTQPHNCLSIQLKTNQIRFSLKTEAEWMHHLIGRISTFASKIACKDYDKMNIELSFGKQFLTVDNSESKFMPDNFVVPNACIPPHNDAMSQVFSGARFYDKLPESCINDFTRHSLIKSLAKHIVQFPSIDIYWKHLESKTRFRTKLHLDANGNHTLVYCSKTHKPMVLTFTHPIELVDFRIRINILKIRDPDFIKQHDPSIIDLLNSMTIHFNDNGGVVLDYPKLFSYAHYSFRLKKKTRFESNDYRASIHNTFTSHLLFTGELPEYHKNIRPARQNADPVVTTEGNEFTIKSYGLKQLMKNFLESENSDAFDDTKSLRSTISDTRSVIECKFKDDMVREIKTLIDIGSSVASELRWSFTK
jgi:hypothetical protein